MNKFIKNFSTPRVIGTLQVQRCIDIVSSCLSVVYVHTPFIVSDDYQTVFKLDGRGVRKIAAYNNFARSRTKW